MALPPVAGPSMRRILLLFALLLPAAAATAVDLQEGDLLFVTAGDSGLSAAIDDATGTQAHPGFDHVGLVAATTQGWEVLGRPYNASYVPNDDSYYCSDFIERAFRAHHVFALQPMNFRNPQTGKIARHWIDLYRSMGMDVPQGVPGTNPNDMSAAPVLERIGTLE